MDGYLFINLAYFRQKVIIMKHSVRIELAYDIHVFDFLIIASKWSVLNRFVSFQYKNINSGW